MKRDVINLPAVSASGCIRENRRYKASELEDGSSTEVRKAVVAQILQLDVTNLLEDVR